MEQRRFKPPIIIVFIAILLILSSLRIWAETQYDPLIYSVSDTTPTQVSEDQYVLDGVFYNGLIQEETEPEETEPVMIDSGWTLYCDVMKNENWVKDEISNPEGKPNKEGHRKAYCGKPGNWIIYLDQDGIPCDMIQVVSGSTGGILHGHLYSDSTYTQQIDISNVRDGDRLYWTTENNGQVWHHTGVLNAPWPYVEPETDPETDPETEPLTETQVYESETESETEVQTETELVETETETEEPQTETEEVTESEYESESESELETEADTENTTETESETEPVIETEPDTETERITEPVTEPIVESESESETEYHYSDTELGTESEFDSETETELETETQFQSETKFQSETETQSQSETNPVSETEIKYPKQTQPDTFDQKSGNEDKCQEKKTPEEDKTTPNETAPKDPPAQEKVRQKVVYKTVVYDNTYYPSQETKNGNNGGSNGDTVQDNGKQPKTGDTSPLMKLMCELIVSFGVILILAYAIRNRRN